MSARKNLIGIRYGRLVVVARTELPGSRWLCECDCGNQKIAWQCNLCTGKLRSCGCLQKEAAKMAALKRMTHGQTRYKKPSPEYVSWSAAKRRCYSLNDPDYPRYGGRGIVMCARWRNSFENFLADMGRRPSLEHSIERKERDGNYEPGNCVWATVVEQNRNRSSTRFHAARGKALTAAAWSEETGVPDYAIEHRIYAGWTIEKAISTPTRPKLANGMGRRRDLLRRISP